MAGELGLASLAPHNAAGERCGRSVGEFQSLAHATPKQSNSQRSQSVSKKVADIVVEEAARGAGTPIETFATNKRRLGLNP